MSEGEEWTKLLLDLGELRTVGEIGLNLLFYPEAGVPLPQKVTMETSPDGKTWQSLNRRNFNFNQERPRGLGEIPWLEPRSVLALAPGPQNRRVPAGMQYFRVRIQAPKVLIGELIVDPVGD